nr:MAG TPA: hypothetical protein [Caudoviricetes sp.]
MLTITRKDLLLTINDNVIPAMGSSDVPVKFVNDTETYVGFLIEPRAGYYVNGFPKSTVCEYDTSSNIIKIPAEAFKNKGILVIAIALIDNDDSNHIEVTKELALEVTPAPNGTVILPATDTWQTAVKNLVEQLYNQDYKPLYDQALEDINEAVETANTASDNANLASQNVQTAYENLGDYKVENGVMYFKKADGTWNETGVTLAGQTTVKKDEVVLTELDLNTERTATPTIVKVQLKDTSGNTFYVETSADNVYLKGTDGSEISQQNLNDKIGQLINLVAFYSASPVSVLTDLKKYITTIS